MTAFLSLFRGINVGGNRKVKMADLKAVHEALGLRDVLPYIQSGNVIFKSDDTDTARLQKQIEEGFETKFGFHVEVIMRTSDELSAIIEKNPFQEQPDKESKRVAVVFLASLPTLQHRKLFSRHTLDQRKSFSLVKKCISIILMAAGAQNYPMVTSRKS